MTLPRWVRALLREPVVQFLAVGLLLIGGYALFSPGSYGHIEVDDRRIAQLVAAHEAQFGSPPSPERLEWLIDDYIAQELLYREALRLDLADEDEVVRRRMVQKMEYLMDSEVRDPSEADLRAFYRSHANEYRQPPRVTMSHAFFSDDTGAGSARKRAAQCVRMLGESGRKRDPARTCPDTDNAAFPGPVRFEQVDRAGLERVFGKGDVVTQAFKLEPGSVSTPLRSAYGWHVLAVSDRRSGALQPFAEVRQRVRADFTAKQSQAARERQLRELRKRYTVSRPD